MGNPHRLPGARGGTLYSSVLAWAKAGYSAAEIAEGIGLTGKAKQIAIAGELDADRC
jgi:hypothetical protein